MQTKLNWVGTNLHQAPHEIRLSVYNSYKLLPYKNHCRTSAGPI